MDDLDLMGTEAFRDGIPYDYFRELRQRPGLSRGYDIDGEPLWYLVRHPEVVTVSRDTAGFASSPTTMTSVRKHDSPYPIITFLDAPAHGRMRRLAFKAFAPARITALAGPVRKIVTALLEEAADKQEFDLAEDIALRLPLEVLAELLCVPAPDREMVVGWARRTVNLGDSEYSGTADPDEDVFNNLAEYFLEFARRRKADPADDFMSLLLAARVKDSQLSAEEAGIFATTLITAGSETTYCAITGGVLALLESPGQIGLLREDRGKLPGAIDEILRWVTPVTHFARRTVTDTEISGQRISAGERVVLWYPSANRDEAVFAEPDRFDVTRSPNPHITFGGGGPHVCIGNGLAMLEIRQFLDAVLDMLPRLELTGPPVRPETNFMNSIKHLPMRVR
jgi:cholest-4-en-3-one 26-monooxygenase